MTINQIQMAISLLPIAYVAITAIPIGWADYSRGRVPNKIVMPLLVLTLLCWLTLAIWQGEWHNLGNSILLFIGVTALGLFLSTFEMVGMGDVKYIGALTLIIGWFSWFWALLFFPIILLIGVIIAILFVLSKAKVSTVRLSPIVIIAFTLIMAISYK